MWWRTQTNNTQHHCPPVVVVTHSAVLAQLKAAKLLH